MKESDQLGRSYPALELPRTPTTRGPPWDPEPLTVPTTAGRTGAAPRLRLIRFHWCSARPYSQIMAPDRAKRARQRPCGLRSSRSGRAQPEPPARMSWACLLGPVFDLDIEQCPRCGGRWTIVAAIVDPRRSSSRSSRTWACPPELRPAHRRVLSMCQRSSSRRLAELG